MIIYCTFVVCILVNIIIFVCSYCDRFCNFPPSTCIILFALCTNQILIIHHLHNDVVRPRHRKTAKTTTTETLHCSDCPEPFSFHFPSLCLKFFFSTILPIVGRTQYQENLINFAPFFFISFISFSPYISHLFLVLSFSLLSLSLNTRSDTHILNPLYIHHVLQFVFPFSIFSLHVLYTFSLSQQCFSYYYGTATNLLPLFLPHPFSSEFFTAFEKNGSLLHRRRYARCYTIFQQRRAQVHFGNHKEYTSDVHSSRTSLLQHTPGGAGQDRNEQCGEIY